VLQKVFCRYAKNTFDVAMTMAWDSPFGCGGDQNRLIDLDFRTEFLTSGSTQETAMRVLIALSVAFATAQISCVADAQSLSGLPTTKLATHGMQLELQKPFNTRSPWRFVATESAPTRDYGDMEAPGALTLCLQKGRSGACLTEPVTPSLRPATPDDPPAWEPHYLMTARAVYPQGRSAPPLLLLVLGSLNAADGDQIVYTQLLAYDVGNDMFVRVYENRTGRNNNQETRFITDGPLRGSVVSAQPQQRAPFGYWIVVSKSSSGGDYRPVLHYLSATRYNDGNALAAIDSEMPNIQQRLGLWKPGQPIPAPSAADRKSCTNPTLKHSELWCE
jgi:hypothetical protein